ncbi:Hypothetical protein NGK_0311 [Neisseria gonorrhoeae NCCP11945]|uniref:Uncharacterized protein n=1 Tax=Neisseria gonorrhoeae (strain NCCP11945) TaxID=521006 RepID=B4RJK1_NEIG2|nr:Hypothetical protein NGK_0311 [Neisseria gonorrhoeae NCCP11945]
MFLVFAIFPNKLIKKKKRFSECRLKTFFVCLSDFKTSRLRRR